MKNLQHSQVTMFMSMNLAMCYGKSCNNISALFSLISAVMRLNSGYVNNYYRNIGETTTMV